MNPAESLTPLSLHPYSEAGTWSWAVTSGAQTPLEAARSKASGAHSQNPGLRVTQSFGVAEPGSCSQLLSPFWGATQSACGSGVHRRLAPEPGGSAKLGKAGGAEVHIGPWVSAASLPLHLPGAAQLREAGGGFAPWSFPAGRWSLERTGTREAGVTKVERKWHSFRIWAVSAS